MSRPVALVTGSSRGLGRALALEFARTGWDLRIHCLRSVDAAEDVARQARALGADAAVLTADLGDPDGPAALLHDAMQRGPLGCLVNNAAITVDAPLARQTESDWDAVVATDLLAPIALSRRAARAMPPGGQIVNVISICGLWGCAGAPAYSAAKAALGGFTAAAAAEFASRGVRLNAVAPGYMPTDMGRAAPGAMDAARAAHAMGTLSAPEDAAAFIAGLARMQHVTGQVFVLDGRIR